MSPAPADPSIYHITHLGNLAQIVGVGGLWSDAERLARKLDCQSVGMPGIKQRRLEALEVHCHPGTMVGEYVPFYFCPRSIMLYVLYRGNHPELNYRGGQAPILHLVASLQRVVAWANAAGRRWTFSNCNAGANYAAFYNDLRDLDKINWAAVEAIDFRPMAVREGKQAEFLLHSWCPWDLVERIGVIDARTRGQVEAVLHGAAHSPLVTVERGWYY